MEAENTQFAPNKRLLVLDPNFHLDLPAGFLDVGVHFSKEWNHNGIVGRTVSFKATPELEIVGLYPLAFTGLPMDFRGFANFVLPKGRDGFGNKTASEILSRPQLQLDLGGMLYKSSHKPDLYLAVEVWNHKFGDRSNVSLGHRKSRRRLASRSTSEAETPTPNH